MGPICAANDVDHALLALLAVPPWELPAGPDLHAESVPPNLRLSPRSPALIAWRRWTCRCLRSLRSLRCACLSSSSGHKADASPRRSPVALSSAPYAKRPCNTGEKSSQKSRGNGGVWGWTTRRPRRGGRFGSATGAIPTSPRRHESQRHKFQGHKLMQAL